MNTVRWQPIVRVCMRVSVRNTTIFHLPLCLKPIHVWRQFPPMQLVWHMALWLVVEGEKMTVCGADVCSKGLGQWLVKLQGAGQACVWESLLLVHSRPPCTGSGSMWKVTNAPKSALLMKTIRGRVASVVCPTQMWLRSSVGGREEVVCKNTSDTFASKIIASFSFVTELCFAGMRWDLEAEEHERCIGCVCKISGPGGEVTWVSSQEMFGREGRTHGCHGKCWGVGNALSSLPGGGKWLRAGMGADNTEGRNCIGAPQTLLGCAESSSFHFIRESDIQI